MSLPTIDDLKIHLNMTGDEHDDELVEMLDAAVDVVTELAGPLSPTEVTEVHYRVSSPLLVLRKSPVVEVTAFASRYGTESTVLVLDDYDIDPEAGIVRWVSGGRFYGDFSITYTAGRATLPAAVRLAILIVAAHLWETQRMPGFQSGDSLPAGFGGVDGVPDATLPGRGFAIPNRAEELLRPYMLGPVIA